MQQDTKGKLQLLAVVLAIFSCWLLGRHYEVEITAFKTRVCTEYRSMDVLNLCPIILWEKS